MTMVQHTSASASYALAFATEWMEFESCVQATTSHSSHNQVVNKLRRRLWRNWNTGSITTKTRSPSYRWWWWLALLNKFKVRFNSLLMLISSFSVVIHSLRMLGHFHDDSTVARGGCMGLVCYTVKKSMEVKLSIVARHSNFRTSFFFYFISLKRLFDVVFSLWALKKKVFLNFVLF